MPFRLAVDNLNYYIDLSIEENAENLYQMTLESRTDVIVGIRAYDTMDSFHVHFIGHCGDQTKNLY